MAGEIVGMLVVGSFAAARPTSVDVLGQWRWMTGRQGRLTDPAFSAYLRAVLATLVLDGAKIDCFERLLQRLAFLLAGSGQADELASEIQELRLQLEPARFVDRAWEVTRTMIDERSSQGHYSFAVAHDLRSLGLDRAPDQILVGLVRSAGENTDPVDDAIVRDSFQRHAVEIARSAGDAIAGKVGDHGVVVLLGSKGSPEVKKRNLVALANQIATTARRRFGFTLHFGASLRSSAAALSGAFQNALGAAESALTFGKRLAIASSGATI
jgi:hypothetical protein